MVDIDDLRRHYADCVSILHDMQASSGRRYLGREEPASFRELGRHELESILDPTHFAGAFVTSERSVDPRILAGRLREAVWPKRELPSSGIRLVAGVKRRKAGGYEVAFDNNGAQQAGPYDQVVNALWEGRLAIDRSMESSPTTAGSSGTNSETA